MVVSNVFVIFPSDVFLKEIRDLENPQLEKEMPSRVYKFLILNFFVRNLKIRHSELLCEKAFATVINDEWHFVREY